MLILFFNLILQIVVVKGLPKIAFQLNEKFISRSAVPKFNMNILLSIFPDN